MPVEIEFQGPLRCQIQSTQLAPGAVRSEYDHQLFFTFSHLRPEDVAGASPVVCVDVSAFNNEDSNGVKVVWPGLVGLDRLPADAALLINLVARTATVHHTVTHAVVATGAVPLSQLFAQKGDLTIKLTDRAIEGILDWGLQDGPAPIGATRSSAINKGSIVCKGVVQTHGRAFRYVGIVHEQQTEAWREARKKSKTMSHALLDDIGTHFRGTSRGLPKDAISFNMPFYAHHYPPDGEALYAPSFICFNKRALVTNESELGIRHALVRLLHIALHDQNMTVHRFVETVTEQMHQSGGKKHLEPPSPDFYRCVHAAIGALTLPALCRPYRYDGSCIKTTAVMPRSSDMRKRAALGGDSREMDKLEEEFDTRLHVMSDQLALWGQENGVALDCEDGCLMAKQLYHLVRRVFARGGPFGDEGRCWASILDMFEPLCTRNYCQPAATSGGTDGSQGPPPISHILLLLVDRVTFAHATIRGCAVRSQATGRTLELDQMTNRLQDYLVGEKHAWIEHLGFFAAETTAWQVPSLVLAEQCHGRPNEARLHRLHRLQQVIAGEYRNNTPLFRDYGQMKNQHFDVAGSERTSLGLKEYLRRCIEQPSGTRLFPFYHVITNGDVDRESVCQPGPGERDGKFCTSVVFNSRRDGEYMHCGTFLQRLSLAPDDAVFIPAGPFLTREEYDLLEDKCNASQWPSLYFIQESLHPSGHDGTERLPAGDVFMGTAGRERGMGRTLFRDKDHLPAVDRYDGGTIEGKEGLLCFKMLVRAGVAGKTSFAEALAGFVAGQGLRGDFTVAGWDYFRNVVAEAPGAEDANTLYVVRVFLKDSTLRETDEPPRERLAAPAASEASGSSAA